ncbi:hypothetical protein CEXT_29971 [Caerostris extrusa]|uniref:Uncharacterized protein n=1 Tax=Caerostris extrusa TaxID=172846 RepID=A0AAV4YCE1_CAEEX|nr:hypothetical protein CEXT_29971 [Caerostris extrusa]
MALRLDSPLSQIHDSVLPDLFCSTNMRPPKGHLKEMPAATKAPLLAAIDFAKSFHPQSAANRVRCSTALSKLFKIVAGRVAWK